MSVIEDIRKHISELPQDKLFTTRDLLNYGTRTSIDNAIYNLVKLGEIVRVVRGVFRNPLRKMWVGIVELARVKAESFGRKVISHPLDAAVEIGLLYESDNLNSEYLFSTDGRTSSFRYGIFKIHLKGTSQRKMALGDSRLGKAIRALCFLGSMSMFEDAVETTTDWLTESELEEGGSLCASMPVWLSNYFCQFYKSMEKQIRSILMYNELNEANQDQTIKEPVFSDYSVLSNRKFLMLPRSLFSHARAEPLRL